MLKDNEVLLLKDGNIPVKCTLVATLYADESNRGFAVYDDGTRNKDKALLKIGEITYDNDEVVVEELTNPDEIKYIWGEFKKIYDENFGKQ